MTPQGATLRPELQNILLFNIETCGKALLLPPPAALEVGWLFLLRDWQLAFNTVTEHIALALKNRVGRYMHHPSSQPFLTHTQAWLQAPGSEVR